MQLQKANLQIEELIRDNTNLKRQTDARAGEIQATRYQLKEAENKNQRSNDDNRALALSIRGFKEERKRLEEQCEELSACLDVEIGKLKNIEKEVRGVESGNARLEKTLYQAEKDNGALASDHKAKEEEVKKAENKLKATSNSIAELAITYRNIEQQSSKARGEFERNNAALNNEVGKGKELQSKIAQMEGAIRSQENELDLIIAEEEKLRKEHFASLDKNKNLNSEIDKALALIAEYELVNRELLDEIELFIDQDEQAKSMLSRKEVMRDIVESSLRKIAITEEPIRHLKC